MRCSQKLHLFYISDLVMRINIYMYIVHRGKCKVCIRAKVVT